MYSGFEEREDFKNWKRRKILSLRLGAVITMVPFAIEIMQAIMMRRFIFSTIIGTLILALFGIYCIWQSFGIYVVEVLPVYITDKKKRRRRKGGTKYYFYTETEAGKIRARCSQSQYYNHEINDKVFFFKINKGNLFYVLDYYEGEG